MFYDCRVTHVVSVIFDVNAFDQVKLGLTGKNKKIFQKRNCLAQVCLRNQNLVYFNIGTTNRNAQN